MAPVSDPGSFREIVRTAKTEYPIPYLSAVLGALALSCLGLTADIPAAAAFAAGALGMLAGPAAIGLPVRAALRRPELLRSERHSLANRAFDVFLDPETSASAREQTGSVMNAFLAGEGMTKHSAAKKHDLAAERDMESGNE